MNLDLSTMQIVLLVALVLWDLVWKGAALWQAAQHHERYWFVTLLVLNTAGVLPILYLLSTNMKEEEQSVDFTPHTT